MRELTAELLDDVTDALELPSSQVVEKDFRVVETCGFATFTALQRKGIPSKFLYFPDENHWVLKPQNSILWPDTVLDWLDRWTKRGGKE